jgi:hypothetical protein
VIVGVLVFVGDCVFVGDEVGVEVIHPGGFPCLSHVGIGVTVGVPVFVGVWVIVGVGVIVGVSVGGGVGVTVPVNVGGDVGSAGEQVTFSRHIEVAAPIGIGLGSGGLTNGATMGTVDVADTVSRPFALVTVIARFVRSMTDAALVTTFWTSVAVHV